MIDIRDGGYKSRKMVMAYVVIVTMALGYLAVGRWPGLAVVFPEFCMGLLAAAGIYSGSNAVVKWLGVKAASKVPASAPPTVEGPEAPEESP